MDKKIAGKLSEAIFDAIHGYDSDEKFNALMLCVAAGIVTESDGADSRVFTLLGCNVSLLTYYIEKLSATGEKDESN